MTAFPLNCETFLVHVEVLLHEKNIKQDIHCHHANGNQKSFEEGPAPYPDNRNSSLFVALFHLLNGSQDINGRIQMFVETALKSTLSSTS